MDRCDLVGMVFIVHHLYGIRFCVSYGQLTPGCVDKLHVLRRSAGNLATWCLKELEGRSQLHIIDR